MSSWLFWPCMGICTSAVLMPFLSRMSRAFCFCGRLGLSLFLRPLLLPLRRWGDLTPRSSCGAAHASSGAWGGLFACGGGADLKPPASPQSSSSTSLDAGGGGGLPPERPPGPGAGGGGLRLPLGRLRCPDSVAPSRERGSSEVWCSGDADPRDLLSSSRSGDGDPRAARGGRPSLPGDGEPRDRPFLRDDSRDSTTDGARDAPSSTASGSPPPGAASCASSPRLLPWREADEARDPLPPFGEADVRRETLPERPGSSRPPADPPAWLPLKMLPPATLPPATLPASLAPSSRQTADSPDRKMPPLEPPLLALSSPLATDGPAMPPVEDLPTEGPAKMEPVPKLVPPVEEAP